MSASFQSKRILVVEDDEDCAELLSEALSRLGHRVALSHSGAEALEVTKSFLPEVALVDLGLPDIDGADLGPLIVALCADAPRLIALTGYGDERARERLLAAGFEQHLLKPVHPNTVAALFQEKPASAAG